VRFQGATDKRWALPGDAIAGERDERASFRDQGAEVRDQAAALNAYDLFACPPVVVDPLDRDAAIRKVRERAAWSGDRRPLITDGATLRLLR
jgi:hypothetical protein